LLRYDPCQVKEHGDEVQKQINTKFFASAGCLAVSLLFFLIVYASSEQGEVSSVNSSISSWNKGGDAERMRAIAMKTKIMPGIGTGVNWHMNWTDVEQTEFGSQLEAGLGSELKNYDISYHVFTGNTTMMFPTLVYDETEVPVGEGSSKCIHVVWTQTNNSYIAESYQSIRDFDACEDYNSMWRINDPKVGVNVKSWFETEVNLGCSGSS